MFIEKKRMHIAPRALTANGTVHGLVQTAITRGFYVKQKVVLKSSTQPPLLVEVKRFDSLTSFYVGPLPPVGKIGDRIDISAYLLADGATIEAAEQDRPGITIQEHERAVYVEEPVVAKRVILVDHDGNYYETSNPIPVQLTDGSINIGTVNAEVEVQLSHQDGVPDSGDIHDSVQVGDGVEIIQVNPDGSINVNISEVLLDPLVQNIPVPLANTEQSFTFPLKTKRFMIRVRDSKANIQVAFISGNSSINYFTVPIGNSYWESVDMSSKTIYFQLDRAGKTVEILYWVQP